MRGLPIPAETWIFRAAGNCPLQATTHWSYLLGRVLRRIERRMRSANYYGPHRRLVLRRSRHGQIRGHYEFSQRSVGSQTAEIAKTAAMGVWRRPVRRAFKAYGTFHIFICRPRKLRHPCRLKRNGGRIQRVFGACNCHMVSTRQQNRKQLYRVECGHLSFRRNVLAVPQ